MTSLVASMRQVSGLWCLLAVEIGAFAVLLQSIPLVSFFLIPFIVITAVGAVDVQQRGVDVP